MPGAERQENKHMKTRLFIAVAVATLLAMAPGSAFGEIKSFDLDYVLTATTGLSLSNIFYGNDNYSLNGNPMFGQIAGGPVEIRNSDTLDPNTPWLVNSYNAYTNMNGGVKSACQTNDGYVYFGNDHLPGTTHGIGRIDSNWAYEGGWWQEGPGVPAADPNGNPLPPAPFYSQTITTDGVNLYSVDHGGGGWTIVNPIQKWNIGPSDPNGSFTLVPDPGWALTGYTPSSQNQNRSRAITYANGYIYVDTAPWVSKGDIWAINATTGAATKMLADVYGTNQYNIAIDNNHFILACNMSNDPNAPGDYNVMVWEMTSPSSLDPNSLQKFNINDGAGNKSLYSAHSKLGEFYTTWAPYRVGRFTIKWSADMNADGIVDVGDLGLLSSQWGPATTELPFGQWTADVNSDQVVDVGDLGLLSAAWNTAGPGGLDASAVPLPSAFGAGLVLMGLALRRRR
jgi:hypothetical protein